MRLRTAVPALVAAVVVVVGLAWFEPWRLVTSSSVDEALPTSTGAPAGPPASEAPTAGTASTPTAEAEAPPEDIVLARGSFESAEHETSGDVAVLQLADGRRFVRIEDLATSDGPDLHVWLTDQASGGEWGSYDDGRSVPLGELKANRGNQNYEIPADVAVAGLTTVVIWCDRFDVAFGTAPVRL